MPPVFSDKPTQQLRQRAEHKKTLLDLEARARKKGVTKGCMGVEQVSEENKLDDDDGLN
jgi:hypothetical protein